MVLVLSERDVNFTWIPTEQSGEAQARGARGRDAQNLGEKWVLLSSNFLQNLKLVFLPDQEAQKVTSCCPGVVVKVKA